MYPFKKSIMPAIALLLMFSQHVFAQKISVDTLSISIAGRYAGASIQKLYFPVINSGNIQNDSAINKDLKNRFTNNEYPELSTDSTIIKWADEQVVDLNFEITYLKDGIISLNISAEACGAYCSGWTNYYTYNYLTAQYISIDQVVDTLGKFRNRVMADKDLQYRQQGAQLKTNLTDRSGEIDNETFQMINEYYRNCSQSFHFGSFALHDDYLEIVETCDLPNVVKSLAPEIKLHYQYKDIGSYLKLKLTY
jgi:hypothetical protein